MKNERVWVEMMGPPCERCEKQAWVYYSFDDETICQYCIDKMVKDKEINNLEGEKEGMGDTGS